MPANPKYLSTPLQRVSKITLATLGGFLFVVLIQMAIGKLLKDNTPLLLLSIWTTWIAWVTCMVIVFMVKKTWILWIVFIVVALVCSSIIYLNF